MKTVSCIDSLGSRIIRIPLAIPNLQISRLSFFWRSITSQRHSFAQYVLLISLLFASDTLKSAQALSIAGVDLPERVEVNNTALVLNGAGVRKLMMLKILVGSLYLESPSSDAKAIMGADAPMMLELHFLTSKATSDRLVSTLSKGFKDSSSGNTAPYQVRIDAMADAIRQSDIQAGDAYQFYYQPGVGTTILKNSQPLSVIEGLDYKEVLFGIWLKQGIGADQLRKDLLGL